MANGQDSDEMEFDEDGSGSSDEDFVHSRISTAVEKALKEKNVMPWKRLRNRRLLLPSGSYGNPWSNRFGFGGKQAAKWQEEVRKLGKSAVLHFQTMSCIMSAKTRISFACF